jgi:RNA polymerase sigma-54 factor
MNILRMNTLELGEYLCRQAEENPVLEEEPDAHRLRAWEALRASAPWAVVSSPGELPESISPAETDTLALFLRDQLSRLGLTKPLETLCLYLAELLDDRGYLLNEDLDDLLETGVPEPLLLEGISLLQSLEPAGIAARSLCECLTLQLDRLPGHHTLPRAMVAGHHLEALSKGHYAIIAKTLDVPVSAVQGAADVIRNLNPRPGSAWSESAPTFYIRPDAWVVETEEGLSLVLNQWDLPRFRLSSTYLKLLETTKDPQVQRYLQEKLQESRWLLHCVTRRENTLVRCLDLLIHRQADYFTGKLPAPAPLSRYLLAEELDLHPSTVSRALMHKYLQCREGVFPLSHFFPRRVGEGNTPRSPLMIQAAIARLIREETPGHPLSDEALRSRLAGEGLLISRRTVAKYREALGLPSSFRRRLSGEPNQ